MKHILVPVDFSDITARVVDQALAMARAFGAELTLLHVVPPEPEFVGYEPGPQTVRDDVARQVHEEHRLLGELDRQVEAAGVKSTALLLQGYPVEKIAKEAARLPADLVVVGSHGRSALRHLLVGSVTDGVLRAVACPVLVVPSPPAGA